MTTEPGDSNVAISVVVPVYNVEDYLEDCIGSIVLQTLDEMEVILVDDGSSDGSLEICERFAMEFAFIRVISKVNGGLSSARNAGLRAALGTYVCFVDSDDILMSDCLGDMYRRCVEHHLDVLRCGYVRIDELGAATTDPGPSQEHFLMTLSGKDYLRSEVRSRSYEVVAPAALFRRDYLNAHSLDFVEGRSHEDHEFFLRCLLGDSEMRAMRIDQVIYGYRIRSGSITTTPSLRGVEDIVANVLSMSRFVRGLGLERDEERVAMRAVSTLFYQATSVYGRLGPEERVGASALIDKRLSLEMAKCAFDARQWFKLILFARARYLVDLAYWIKWRGQYGL